MRETKLGKVIYLKMAMKMSEAIPWANVPQMSLLRVSIRLFNTLLDLLGCSATWSQLWHNMKTHHIPNGKRTALCGEGGDCIAPTTLLRPMNFAQICFSPTDFWNEKKSMRAMDSTCLKVNVSKCQRLSVQSSLPEFAVSAIWRELKGKTALAEDPSDSRNKVFPLLLALYYNQSPISHFVLLTPFTYLHCTEWHWQVFQVNNFIWTLAQRRRQS